MIESKSHGIESSASVRFGVVGANRGEARRFDSHGVRGEVLMNRRSFHVLGTFVLGGIMTLALAIPGVGYLLDPLLRGGGKSKGKSGDGGDSGAGDEEFLTLARLSDLPVGVPRSFPVIRARRDAWMSFPPEPVGSVWVIRKGDGGDGAGEVVAFTSECPHLGCAVNLAADGKSFLCPCHNSGFNLNGEPTNEIPPRPMDTLEVAPLEGENPLVRVKFARFRTLAKEKIPLD